MNLLLSAAESWHSLLETHYSFMIGRSGTAKCINLYFRADDFSHLSGIHYANDVDFKLHRKEYWGARLLPALMSKKLDGSLIEKSRNWPQIKGRLNAILHMRTILESDFRIYGFSPNKLPFHSQIAAEYLLYSEETGDGIFLFFDRDAETYYCKSVFEKGSGDYRTNQSAWTVLTKIKYDNGQEIVLFKHPNYKEVSGQIMT